MVRVIGEPRIGPISNSVSFLGVGDASVFLRLSGGGGGVVILVKVKGYEALI